MPLQCRTLKASTPAWNTKWFLAWSNLSRCEMMIRFCSSFSAGCTRWCCYGRTLKAFHRCVGAQVITRDASTRVAKYAFNYARENGRSKVTAVHKANIMKAADGLFLECCREVSLEYPDILYNEMIVDNTCMQVRLLPLLQPTSMTAHPNQWAYVDMSSEPTDQHRVLVLVPHCFR